MRALEMVINGNNCGERTPISSHHGAPLPPPSASSSSTSTNRVYRVMGSNQIGAPSSGSRTTNSAGQTPAGHGGKTIGSITNSAAFNRFQTPLRNVNNGGASGASVHREKEGIPVANRRQQRRSKSVEMWLDHKPPATPKTGNLSRPCICF